jgi:TolB-like protein/class 3 adenylate cyclase/tetratricopeptide (TPR) repeat protein
MAQSRQLAAIMFTDIVGYTALMGADEQKAFELLRRNRDIQKRLINHYNGTWIKELGDGVLASFHTVTDAVFSAAAIHQACTAVEGLKLRIGIHLGEVIFENNDVFGDGVNIASRLQAMASIGSTWVSEAVYKNVVNKKEITSEFIKEEHLKNVSEPVKIYEVTVKQIPDFLPDNIKAYKEQSITGSSLKKKTLIISAVILLFVLVAAYFIFFRRQPGPVEADSTTPGKSIAVLPFVNLSNDPKQEYFSDGITEDIITQVSKISDLKVISRTAVMQYKSTKKTAKEIGEELKVATILEGSIRRAGNQVRVVAQLINTKTDEHLWAETYDEVLTQIFSIQGKVAGQIASALKARFTPSDKEQSERKLTENPAAYDFYLRGKFYFNEDNGPGMDTAIIIFERAISADSKFALAYASLARAYAEKFFKYDPQKKWREQAFVALEKALALDPGLPEAYLAKARLLWIPENHFPHEQAIAELRQALSLRPNFVEARTFLSSIYSHIGLHDKASEELQKALDLNPHDLETLSQLSHQFYYQMKFDEMLAVVEKLPKDFGGPFNVARNTEVLLRMGRRNEVKIRIADLLQQYPENSVINSLAAIFYASGGNKKLSEQKIEIAIRSGKSFGHFHHTSYNIGVAYAIMNNNPEAIRWLQNAAEDGLPCYTFFANDPFLNNLRNNADFISFLNNLKKQWEQFKISL